MRGYRPPPQSPRSSEAVKAAGEKAHALTATPMRRHLLTAEEMSSEMKGMLGDYGRTIWEPHYLILSAREAELRLVRRLDRAGEG